MEKLLNLRFFCLLVLIVFILPLINAAFTDTKTYTLTNPGNTPITWTASNTQIWTTLSKTSGTLAANGGTDSVVVSFNSNANTLQPINSMTPRTYTDTITFTNLLNGNGNTQRTVSLTINPSATCGNSIIEYGEQCDLNNLNNQNCTSLGYTNGTLSCSSCSFNTNLCGSSSVLVPGNGWTGATPQSAQVGSGQASDRYAIAHWDAVQYMTVNKTINIGILAYHYNDIANVSFSINNGPWIAVKNATYNPSTSAVIGGITMPAVKEYWVTLDASKFSSDGLYEIRAIVYPKVGMPKVLQGTTVTSEQSPTISYDSSLWINVDSPAGGSLSPIIRYVSKSGSDGSGCGQTSASPCLTIAQALASLSSSGGINGGELRLGEGSWALPALGSTHYSSSATRWTTITSAPNANPDLVFIDNVDADNAPGDTGGPGLKFLRLYNLTVRSYVRATYSETYLWFDHATIEGTGTNPYVSWDRTGSGHPYFDSIFYTDINSPSNYNSFGSVNNNIALIRNLYSDDSLDGHVSGVATVINYYINNARGGATIGGTTYDVHGDLYQFGYHRTSDIILYHFQTIPGGQINARGLASSGGSMSDVAMINFNISMPSSSGQQFGISDGGNHILVKDSYFGEGGGGWGTGAGLQNVLVENSYWSTADATYHVPVPACSLGIKYVPGPLNSFAGC